MLLRNDVFRRLCEAREVLSTSDGLRLSIDAVAEAVEMSPFHFIRRFEALFGVTPHQLRIRTRLDRAKHLLALGGHSVTEVCMEVGFSSLGSFSELFSRRVGEAPSAYRSRMRVMVQVPGSLPQEVIPGCLGLMERLPASTFRSFREA